jgi:hypothetical protein
MCKNIKRIFGPQGKRKLGPSSNSPNNATQTKSTTMCDKADDIAILGRNTVFIIEKIVDVWYLGTNQNGIIFELLTANTYMNQRTHPTCIYNV